MDSLFSRQQSQLSAGRPGGPGRFGGGGQQPQHAAGPVDLLFNHFGKQNSLHDHSMLLFEHKQAGPNALNDGFGNKDWQVQPLKEFCLDRFE
jgi:hypothetical protein